MNFMQANLKWNKHIQRVLAELKARLVGLSKSKFLVPYKKYNSDWNI